MAAVVGVAVGVPVGVDVGVGVGVDVGVPVGVAVGVGVGVAVGDRYLAKTARFDAEDALVTIRVNGRYSWDYSKGF